MRWSIVFMFSDCWIYCKFYYTAINHYLRYETNMETHKDMIRGNDKKREHQHLYCVLNTPSNLTFTFNITLIRTDILESGDQE